MIDVEDKGSIDWDTILLYFTLCHTAVENYFDGSAQKGIHGKEDELFDYHRKKN